MSRQLKVEPIIFAIGFGLLSAAVAMDSGRSWPVVIGAFLFWPAFSVFGQWFL